MSAPNSYAIIAGLTVASVAFHGGLYFLLYSAHASNVVHRQTVIIQQQKEKKKDEDKKKDEKPVKAEEKVLKQIRQPTAPKPEAPQPNQPSAAMQAMPEFGIAMGSGALGGGSGINVGIGVSNGQLPDPGTNTASSGQPVAPQEKTFGQQGVQVVNDTCNEPQKDAVHQGGPQPPYPDSARESGIQGVVKVKLMIDASGRVTSASIAQGLGPAFDQAARQAAMQHTYSAATKCGKAVASAKFLSFRFSLNE